MTRSFLIQGSEEIKLKLKKIGFYPFLDVGFEDTDDYFICVSEKSNIFYEYKCSNFSFMDDDYLFDKEDESELEAFINCVTVILKKL